MKVNFFNETEYDVKDYQNLIKKMFRKEKEKKLCNIIFVTEEQIQEYNRIYRNIDRVTDVITFALWHDSDSIVKGAEKELGDIFICLKRAFEQAEQYGHSHIREVCFLAVHGYLHLLGYDHETKEQEDEMFTLQEDYLERIKLERERIK